MLEKFVDGNLLQEAAQGNHEAIRQVARMTITHLQDMAVQCTTGHDALIPWIVDALTGIVGGKEPNKAFNWNRVGDQPSNNNYLDWNIAQHVQQLIDTGLSKVTATSLVARAACMDGKKCGRVDKVHLRYFGRNGEVKIDVPDSLYPIPEQDLKKVGEIDRRLVEELAKRRK